METLSLQAEVRSNTGKTDSRITRSEGKVPSVLYGQKGKVLHFSVHSRDLRKALRTNKKRNVVFALEGIKGEKLVMIKDLQVHPVSDVIVHADFQRVKEDVPVVVSVPVSVVGEAPGVVQQGGSVDQPMHSIKILVRPDCIPMALEASVEGLFVGQSINAGAITLPDGCTLVTTPDLAVAAVQATRATRLMDDEEGEEGVTDEGTEGADDAESGEES